MVYTLQWTIEGDESGFARSDARYGLVERAARAAAARGGTLLAFGLAPREVRLVVEGSPEAARNAARGAKVGTLRSLAAEGVRLRFGRTDRARPRDLVEAVAWAHRAPIDAGAPGPLASPWSSHRDLLGWRFAAFFDAEPLRLLVDPKQVHALVGGGELPRPVAPPGRREPLPLLLRLAAGLRGVLPADRRCFGLFTQIARARGWATAEIADALMLTPRRIRQLARQRDPLVSRALGALADPRLIRVP